MTGTDLALDYMAGLKLPDSSVIGLPAVVDSVGTNLSYSRTANPRARDANGGLRGTNDTFDLVPLERELNTTDATVTPLVTIALPNNHALELRIVYYVRTTGDVFSARWMRVSYMNVDGAISTLGATIDERVAVDPTGIGGVTFTTPTNGLTVNVTGKVATNLFWHVNIQEISKVRINR